MLSRMVTFAGLPFLTATLFFPAFYYLKVVQEVEVPTWVVYIFSFIGLGGSLMGISYGVLSASWDPRREGSKLGFEEFQRLVGTCGRVRRRDHRPTFSPSLPEGKERSILLSFTHTSLSCVQ